MDRNSCISRSSKLAFIHQRIYILLLYIVLINNYASSSWSSSSSIISLWRECMDSTLWPENVYILLLRKVVESKINLLLGKPLHMLTQETLANIPVGPKKWHPLQLRRISCNTPNIVWTMLAFSTNHLQFKCAHLFYNLFVVLTEPLQCFSTRKLWIKQRSSFANRHEITIIIRIGPELAYIDEDRTTSFNENDRQLTKGAM